MCIRDSIDFDTKMKTLQSELRELLIAEEKSKADLLTVFKAVSYTHLDVYKRQGHFKRMLIEVRHYHFPLTASAFLLQRLFHFAGSRTPDTSNPDVPA